MEHVEAQLDAAEEREEMTERQPDSPAFCWATELAMTQQPVTLSVTEAREVSAEMQRLHSENETLRVERERNLNSIRVNNEIINKKRDENETLQAGYAAARLEIESLQARIKTMTEEHADELMVAHLDGRMRAAQPAPQQEAQASCPTCIALARTVMLDQVSFDRKPDCYGIRRITDDEGVEEWEDIRTSPDVAREEANDMMATGRGEIYEVVPLYTTPQPVQVQAHAGMVPLTKEQRSRIVLTVNTVSDAIDMVEQHHGITGGQHGADI